MNFYKLPNKEKDLIYRGVSQEIDLPPAAIEKDWWVVQTLRIVFGMEVAPHLVFKGGTSLSKAWGLIERFSEDIDLALSREFLGFSGDISRTQVTKLRDASFDYISGVFLTGLRKDFIQNGFDEVEIDLIEVKTRDQDPVQIAIKYPAVTEKNEYILPQVVLEIGSRAMRDPYSERNFCSYVGAQYKGRDFADSEITIPCVNPERTFLEKLFLLHEEFQRPEEKIRVERLSRHFYDIEKIAQTPYAQKAIKDHVLYQEIINHRNKFSKLGGVDYKLHIPPNLNPIPPDKYIGEWEKDYKKMQAEMIYSESLPFPKLMSNIQSLVDQMNQEKF